MQHQDPYAGTDKKPNVIWFMVDQMRAQAMSIAGDPNIHTPNLDRLCRDGTWFKNAVSGFPLCCPARGSFITGQYPHKCVPGHEFGMDSALETVADPFNEAGYHTAYLGKWHLNGWHEGYGRGGWHIIDKERRGRFQTWIGYENNNSQFDCWVHGHDGNQDVELYKLPGHETDALTDMLLEQIEKHKDENFFHVCSVQPPHDPYSAPAQWAGGTEVRPRRGTTVRPARRRTRSSAGRRPATAAAATRRGSGPARGPRSRRRPSPRGVHPRVRTSSSPRDRA
jgi:arylsulfatase A-like enzyme